MAMYQQLSKARNLLNLSQAEVAEAVNIQRAALSKIENGKQEIPSALILFYNRTHKINMDWLATGEGEPFKKGEGINTGISVTKTGTFNTSESSGNKVSLPNVATPANSTEEKLWQRIKELEEQNKQLVILLMQQATKKE